MRARKREAGLLVSPKQARSPVPGDRAWCGAHGFHPRVWKARGVWRYDTSDRERVKDAFRKHLPKTRLGTISKAVGQAPGLVMLKHPLPGRPPIPPQLRPDDPVIMDNRPTWHYHGPDPEPGEWLVFPPEAGPRLAGRRLFPVAAGERTGRLFGYVISAERAEDHIARSKNVAYDPAEGTGDHNGVNPDFVHKHAPHAAKYLLFGDNKRIDCHPWVPPMIKKAPRVLFVMEGTLKNDACVSIGEAVLSVPSVTLWEPREVAYAVRWIREVDPDKTFIIIPDADWFSNPLVERQALLLRSCIRRAGAARAFIAAPPVWEEMHECKCNPCKWMASGVCLTCGGYLKGVDDWRGVYGDIDDLMVLGREAPFWISAWTDCLNVRSDRRRRAMYALEGLSLHANYDPESKVPLGGHSRPIGTLTRIMGGIRTRAVVDTLRDLSGALEIDGSLETEVKEWASVDHDTGQVRIVRVLDWITRPTIVVKPAFRAEDPVSVLVQTLSYGPFPTSTLVRHRLPGVAPR